MKRPIYKNFIFKEEAEINSRIVANLRSPNLSICYKTWGKKEMPIFCDKIKQWKVTSLKIYENQHPKILKEISQITFPSLIQINVYGNDIESIQSFHRTAMPFLRKLYIGYNKIRDFSDLKKTNFPLLTTFSFRSGENISQAIWPNLKELYVEYFSTANEQCPDARWILKLQACKLKTIWLKSKDRIKVQGQILKKSSNATIDLF